MCYAIAKVYISVNAYSFDNFFKLHKLQENV